MPTLFTNHQRWKNLALSGPLSAIMFAVCVIGFAALRSDDYAHSTKAVSELGAIGAPMAFAFNTFGFIIPGMLILVLAISISNLTPPNTSRVATTLLAMSGIAMILAGVFPVDMENSNSFTSLAHTIGALASGLCWGLSLFWFRKVFLTQMELEKLGRLTLWFLLFPAVNIAWQITWQTTGAVLPGWGQRIAFAGYFLWLSWAGIAIFRKYITTNK